MTQTITLKTVPANRKELAEAFGQNQSAVRRLESMIQDITVTLPDAINNSGGAAATQFLAVQLNGQVALPQRDVASVVARMVGSSAVHIPPRSNNAIRALMEISGFVAQAPGAYKQISPVAAFLQADTTGTALTSGVVANVASLPLPAGTWDVSGTVVFNSASTTVLEQILAGVASASATLGNPSTYQEQQLAVSGAGAITLLAPATRITLANAATVFLVAQATFNISTLSADGYISARPV
ncbi:hypothetical protein [Paraburkholderia sp. GAS82]|uniref:hypothetical protein n=1 Tax=Paraburkholderia sp. GAS82 TaxID=3035137 RepID=UPI003D1FEB76